MKIEINLARGRPRQRQWGPKLRDFKPGKYVKAPPLILIIVAGVLLLLMIAMHFYQNYRVETLDEEIQVALADSAALSETIQMIKDIRMKQQEFRAKIEIVKQLEQKRYILPKLMDQVSSAMPALTWLTKWVPLNQEPGNWFQLEGVSFSNLRVAELMMRLQSMQMIDEIVLINIHEKIDEGVSTMMFTVKCRFSDGSVS